MTMRIGGADLGTPPVGAPKAAEKSGSTNEFAKELEQAISGVSDQLKGADHAAVNALVGNGGPHEAVLAMTKAELSFRFLTQARNKMIDAYQEIMRMSM